MPLGPGSRLDAYELVRPLGAGGMGEVWLATEVRLGRKVALKLLPADLTQDPSRVSRFEQEARAASALSHPNVCTILALGQTADWQHYIAMEYVEGETLRKRLAASHLTVHESLDIAIQIASALTAAHASGIVHRDIKPENVMLRPDGFVKVLDFGLAKLVASSDVIAAQATRTAFKTDVGHVVGTIAYMSPEQAREQQVDARTDVWSLGCVLYEMVAGRGPFAAQSTSDMLAAILDREPDPLVRFEPSVPQELQRIVTKALRKDRGQRYQTVQDLLLDVQTLNAAVGGQARSDSAPAAAAAYDSTLSHVTILQSRRVRNVLFAVAIFVIAAAAVGSWYWARARGAQGSPRPPIAQVQRNLTRLTFDPGLQTDPAFSRDGRFVAFASDRSGNLDIWVQPLGGGDPVQVTRSPAADSQPVWSPDGNTIAFRSERDPAGIYLVPSFGGSERLLIPEAEHPFWSADGRAVLGSRGLGFVGAGRVFAAPTDGGSVRELVPEFAKSGNWRWIDGHPDGRVSFFGEHVHQGLGFFTVSAAGEVTTSDISKVRGQLEGLTQAMNPEGQRFSWSADGSSLFLERVHNGGNIWQVRVTPRALTWESVERLTVSDATDTAVAVSPDGRRLAFSSQRPAERLWRYRVDPVRHQLLDGEPLTPDGDITMSAVRPDGGAAVFNVWRAGAFDLTLRLRDFRAGSVAVFSPESECPVWAPDGVRVAYTRVWRVRTSGTDTAITALAVRKVSGLEKLLSPRSSEQFVQATSWQPDGSTIVATRTKRDGGTNIELWSAEAPRESPLRTLLDRGQVALWQGSLSPNGRWLTFVAVAPGSDRPSIAVTSVDGPPDRRWWDMAPTLPWTDKPRWSTDGRRLFFISRPSPEGLVNLWATAVNQMTGQPEGPPYQISRFDSVAMSISPYTARTEMFVTEQYVFLPIRTASANIWMLDNVGK